MIKKGIFLVVILSIISCGNSLSDKEKEVYTTKGNEIVKATFSELSGNLMGQMKMGGPSKAIPFCNEQALPITNQLAEKFEVSIKRTSNKLRNSDNKPTERELQIIEQYANSINNKASLEPIVEVDAQNKKHYYAPIIMQANCLVCHGTLNETVAVKTDSIIKSLYANDIATGYSEGDLRGIWSIAFNN
jgi:hypothetical protein